MKGDGERREERASISFLFKASHLRLVMLSEAKDLLFVGVN
jgi:hypothetical protein